jgi:carboxyl-terminal processing protease
LKKLSFRPATVVPAVIIIAALSFFAGDALHGYVQLPFLPPPSNIDFSSLNDLYSLMKVNFDGSISPSDALNGAKAGLVAAGGDPYTEYFSPTEAKALNSDLSDTLSGIGAEIGIKNGSLTVIAPIAGAPAQKAGLEPGDVIEYINNVSTTNMNVDTAVDDIRGKAGTSVTLKIERADAQEPLTSR